MAHGDALKDGGFFIGQRAHESIFAILLDSRSNGAEGGTGVTFDWNASREMVQAISLTLPVIVAGGLTGLNVAKAMKMFQPFGVDVASGVEASAGRKDPQKMRAFVKAVRDIDGKTS